MNSTFENRLNLSGYQAAPFQG